MTSHTCRAALAALLLCAGFSAGAHAIEIDAVPPQASRRVATVQVRVAPEHRDWTYQPGQPARFRVAVTADNQPIEGVPVSYTVGPELLPAQTRTAVVPLEGLVIDGGTLNGPGFIRLHVTTEVAGRTYRGSGTAAFSPELIQPTQVEPADFDAFWARAKAELATIPMEPRLVPMPEASTSTVDVFHLSLRTIGQSWQGPAHLYGILCVPKADGKFPAVLRVPGAGVRPYAGDIGLAERGVITLEIGIHGIPLNLPKQVYSDLLAGALNEYWLFNADNKESFYYRRVYLSCLRANDYLASLPKWDGQNLLVAGASQGGQLSIVTAALDPRVTGLAVTHPAFCDVSGPLHGRAGGWPHPFRPDPATGAPSRHATPAKIETVTYYDAVNFARRLKVPGFYNWGYNDEVCPPTSTYAAYNVITAPKELAVTLELAHDYTPEQYDAITGWLVKQLAIR